MVEVTGGRQELRVWVHVSNTSLSIRRTPHLPLTPTHRYPHTDTHTQATPTQRRHPLSSLPSSPGIFRNLGRSYLARLDACDVANDESMPLRCRRIASGESLGGLAALEHEPRGGGEQAEREDQRDLGVPTHGTRGTLYPNEPDAALRKPIFLKSASDLL